MDQDLLRIENLKTYFFTHPLPQGGFTLCAHDRSVGLKQVGQADRSFRRLCVADVIQLLLEA